MSPRRKPATPEQIAARAMLRRAAEREADRNPEAWGVNVSALAMPANADVVILDQARGEKPKPARRISGLDWLLNKGRLNDHQYSAGVRYGDDYRAAYDLCLRSCLNDSVSGGDPAAAQEAKFKAGDRIYSADHDGLRSHQEMIVLCKMVLGEGVTVRSLAGGNDEITVRKEVTLTIALELLAKHYGMY